MPAWSSDGKFVFFVSNRTGKNEIYRLQVNTGELKKLTNTSSGNIWPFPLP
ncbi:MAG: hypothetical protein HGA53_03400 [Anaerolineaceae bacterium]|nr:hypothetical protein [Anaerolineaceae bacterium]